MTKPRFTAFLIIIAIAFGLHGAKGQVISNRGTEFWATFPTHEPDFDKNLNTLYANFSIFITGDEASSGTITAGAFSQTFTVAANSVTEVKIPRNDAYINDNEGNSILPNRAIHIVVDPEKPKIVVYAHIFAGQRSAATLILPKEALGTNYYSINYKQYADEGKNYIAVVATESGTKIHIKKGNTELVPGGVTLNNVNDVYEYLSDGDLTGVSVSVDPSSACSRFAMFSGSTGIKINYAACSPGSLDPLFQQCYPVENWGLNYGFIPFSMQSPGVATPVRTAGQLVRVLAKDNGTDVAINGKLVASLNSGEYYTTPVPLQNASMISATKQVCVAQYALSQSCDNSPAGTVPNNYSDPDMVILNPVDYSIKNITVYSSAREDIKEQYINVLIKTTAASTFKVNKVVPPAAFALMPGHPEYSWLQLNLNNYPSNTFNLSADEGFNAIAYGFGNVESYAYSAGTNIVATEAITGISKTNGFLIDSACVDEDYFFKLTLPYQPAQLVWKMDKADVGTVQQNPAGNAITVNGNTGYEYSFPKPANYTKAGIHYINIISSYPQTGSCKTGQQEISYIFKVNAPAAITLAHNAEACANTITFTASVDVPDHNVASWHWDFGDGTDAMFTNAEGKAPSHTYTTTGTHLAKLLVTLNNGCQSILTLDIYIDPGIKIPEIQFDALSDVCINSQPFPFTQAREIKGIAGTGVYSGDGVSDDVFNPAAAGLGDHEIRYSFATAGGCTVSATQTIHVISNPRVTGDTVYLMQAGNYTLRPVYSTSNTPLTYKWTPSTGLDRDDVAYPSGWIGDDSNYTITVSNGYCSTSAIVKIILLKLPQTVNTFTPNGDGINDFWEIKNIGNYPRAIVDIYNRYGTGVFHSEGYPRPWDGKFNGAPVPVGTYYYLIRPGVGVKPLSGAITLIR